jgi:hypothetical protein
MDGWLPEKSAGDEHAKLSGQKINDKICSTYLEKYFS